MGPLETAAFIGVTWLVAGIGFFVGFLFRPGAPGPALLKFVLPKKPLSPKEPKESKVAGVDVSRERSQMVVRAKQEFGMSEAEAGKFADDIIKQAGPLLGRLHSRG